MADERSYEILEDGRPTRIIELPVEWIMDDYPYFAFERFFSLRPLISPQDVGSIWKTEFDQALAEGTKFILTMHPNYIGHRSRIILLEELIRCLKARTGVWFATHEAIAR